MAFWGTEVKPGKPFTLKATEATGRRRLHLSQATLRGIGSGKTRNILVCNVGSRRPVYLCVLTPEKVDCCQLNMEFEEADEVIFSVIGPLTIHISGYFLGTPTASRLNDGETLPRADDLETPTASRLNDGETLARAGDLEVGNKDNNDHTIPKVVSSENPLPSRITSSKERSCSLEKGELNANFEKTPEARTLDKREDKPLSDVELPPGCENKDKRNKEGSTSLVVGNSNVQGLENEKPATEKEIKPSSDVLPSQHNERKRKTKDVLECSENKKQANDKDVSQQVIREDSQFHHHSGTQRRD